MNKLFRLAIAGLICALSAPGAFGGGEGEEGAGSGAEGAGGAAAGERVGDAWSWDTLAEYESATGNRILSFQEAPVLAAMVADGRLPPVDERLPEEPLVFNVFEEIGQYGGTLRMATVGAGYNDFTPIRDLAGTVHIANHGPGHPHQWVNYAHKKNTLSDDAYTFTMELRRGMKWSDGEPYTADDVVFWAEEVLLHPDTPSGGWVLNNFGPISTVERVDDYTVKLHWSEPNPTAMSWMEFWGGWYPIRYPKHYLSKWHPRYNDEAEELAKEEGFESWVQAFGRKSGISTFGQDDEPPTIRPWLLGDVDPTYRTFVRNPYHFAIDTAGNQLPYIDVVRVEVVNDNEGKTLKAVSGELDVSGFGHSAADIPLYKDGEEKADYMTLLWPRPAGAEAGYGFNMTSKDPVLREIFGDLRFRQAMSLAINRDEINEVMFFGMAVPRQAAMDPENSYYKEQWANHLAEYDPQRANALLDEMGLQWDSNNEFRLRPDGKVLEAQVWINNESQSLIDISELVKEYWEDVGLKVDMRTGDVDLVETRISTNDHDIAVWFLRRTNPSKGFSRNNKFITGGLIDYAREWWRWVQTGGEGGEEPPEEFKQFYALAETWYSTTDLAERDRIAQQIFDFASENVLIIGTVGYAPVPVIVHNRVGNIPRDARWFGDDTQFLRDVKPDQWFIRQ